MKLTMKETTLTKTVGAKIDQEGEENILTTSITLSGRLDIKLADQLGATDLLYSEGVSRPELNGAEIKVGLDEQYKVTLLNPVHRKRHHLTCTGGLAKAQVTHAKDGYHATFQISLEGWEQHEKLMAWLRTWGRGPYTVTIDGHQAPEESPEDAKQISLVAGAGSTE